MEQLSPVSQDATAGTLNNVYNVLYSYEIQHEAQSLQKHHLYLLKSLASLVMSITANLYYFWR